MPSVRITMNVAPSIYHKIWYTCTWVSLDLHAPCSRRLDSRRNIKRLITARLVSSHLVFGCQYAERSYSYDQTSLHEHVVGLHNITRCAWLYPCGYKTCGWQVTLCDPIKHGPCLSTTRWVSCSIALYKLPYITTFLGTINLLHFTPLFVFTSSRYHIIF